MVNTELHGQFTENYAVEIFTYDGDPDKVDALTCEMCRSHVGLATGDGEYPTAFTLYYALHLAGDTADTLFCEDCYGWLTDAVTVPLSQPTPTPQGDPS